MGLIPGWDGEIFTRAKEPEHKIDVNYNKFSGGFKAGSDKKKILKNCTVSTEWKLYIGLFVSIKSKFMVSPKKKL